MPTHDLRRCLSTLIRVLALIGLDDNARAIERRLFDLEELAHWVARSEYGWSVWDEITGGLEVANKLLPVGSQDARSVLHALKALEEARVELEYIARRSQPPPQPRPGLRALPAPAKVPSIAYDVITLRLVAGKEAA